MIRLMILCVVAAFSTACSASISSQRLDPKTWQATGEKVMGVIHYQPVLAKVLYEFTLLTDKDGNVLGSAEKKTCEPAPQKEEIQVLPDFDRPVALLNDPAALANSKFGATLSNGLLQSVNSETSSTAAELLSAAAEVAGVFTPAAVEPGKKPEGPPACNAGPKLKSAVRLKLEGS